MNIYTEKPLLLIIIDVWAIHFSKLISDQYYPTHRKEKATTDTTATTKLLSNQQLFTYLKSFILPLAVRVVISTVSI